jgi:hypothetical protein
MAVYDSSKTALGSLMRNIGAERPTSGVGP